MQVFSDIASKFTLSVFEEIAESAEEILKQIVNHLNEQRAYFVLEFRRNLFEELTLLDVFMISRPILIVELPDYFNK